MGQNYHKKNQKQFRTLGQGQTGHLGQLGHLGHVLARLQPFSAVLAHFTSGLGTPEGAQNALKWPKIT